MNIDFSNFPLFSSERLVYRRLVEEDLPQLFALRSNPEAMKYIPRIPHKSIEDARAQLIVIDERIASNEGINWAVTKKNEDKMIGIVGHYKIDFENFRSEIGYMFLPEYQGKGYGTEMVKALLDFGFTYMGLHSIEAVVDPNNLASGKILEKNGFRKEAHIKENFFFEGQFLDSVIYGKLKSEHL
jgi:[ribosomal protein S5]-alanine N-acetyltransferase